MKDLRKTGNIADIANKKRISIEQIKKLFDRGELGQAEQSYRERPSFTSISFLADEEKSTPAIANNSVLAKNTSRS